MRDIFFREIRECNRAIKNIVSPDERENGDKILLEIIEKMCELTSVGRKEGLLALEEAVQDLSSIHNGKQLRSMVTLIIDGTDPELVEEILTAKYYAEDLTGYEALHYLLMMYGCLAVQTGENPRIIEEKLLALVPDRIADLYYENQNQTAENRQKHESTKDLDILNQYYNGGIAAAPGDAYYFQIKVADYAVRSLDDRCIQRVLKEVDNYDLSLAMKGLSGEARHRLFDNLSKRVAEMIAEDMDLMGPVMIRDVVSAITKIFNIIIVLISKGEIVSPDEEALCLFAKIFNSENTETMKQSARENESEMYQIMQEYKSSVHRTINAPWKQ